MNMSKSDKLYYKDGSVSENFDFDKILHRIDGPAIERYGGYKRWCIDGKTHRLDGPAIKHANGGKSWYIDGERLLGEAEFEAHPLRIEYLKNKGKQMTLQEQLKQLRQNHYTIKQKYIKESKYLIKQINETSILTYEDGEKLRKILIDIRTDKNCYKSSDCICQHYTYTEIIKKLQDYYCSWTTENRDFINKMKIINDYPKN